MAFRYISIASFETSTTTGLLKVPVGRLVFDVSTNKLFRKTSAGVVSTAPGFILNQEAIESFENPVLIALKGRVPVKVSTVAKKGDFIIVDPVNFGQGKAVGSNINVTSFNLIGIALADSDSGVVEVKI